MIPIPPDPIYRCKKSIPAYEFITSLYGIQFVRWARGSAPQYTLIGFVYLLVSQNALFRWCLIYDASEIARRAHDTESIQDGVLLLISFGGEDNFIVSTLQGQPKISLAVLPNDEIWHVLIVLRE